MDVGRHQVTDRLVDELMTTQRSESGESLRHDQNREVPATVGGASVARVTMTVVDDFESRRHERLQAPGELLEPRFAQGSTLTKGRTSTDSNTPSVT